ncbi:MAG TPA: efflux RND transporter periplasmic adaptor subunit [Actinophytocola sp.]|uniref:efflux RND transporter periplasmic adaptor subunit n=1 Tax=Actinophytocola sp. TaxID=1872138 RepID=UPI002DB9B069|nr:efflux RND transporter periplasmic adaptor subunit [Actinophytocola sp.]HEU5469828.1 efflux RND transporter periplasmic adaptor subunit [Actinophytocola sp.]
MRRRKRILAINVVLVLALAAAGWGAYTLLWPSTESNAASGVRTTAATRTSVVETVSAAATVQSAYTATADFGTSGTVTEINVKVGDVVAAGQQLAELDATEAQQQVAVAQANLDAAEEDLDTAESAEDSATTPGGGNTQSVTSLKAKVEQAELALKQAKDTRAATVLTAPGAGTVTAINGSVGQRAGTGSSSSQGGTGGDTDSSSAFIVLTDLGNLLVKATVAEIDVSKIKVDQPATVTVNALPDTPVNATVTAVDLTPTTGNNNIVQFGVALGLTAPPEGLRPGQSASVAITVARADDALAVPSAAVRGNGGQSTVTVLVDGAQTTRTVEVGVRSEALVQITSGLSEGDQVVLTTTGTGQNGTGGTGRVGGGGGGGFQGGPGGGGTVLIPGGGR